MNFKLYSNIKKILLEEDVVDYQEVINENLAWVDSNNINELYAWAFVKNPIKAIKLFGNQKKLMKSYIDKASAEINLSKKKEAAKKIPDQAKSSAQKTRIDNVHKVEVNAIDGKIKDIKQRMTELGEGDSKLAELAAMLKTKASLAANEKLLKGATESIRKELQIKIRNDKEKISNHEKIFKDYESALSAEEMENAKAEMAGKDKKEKAAKSTEPNKEEAKSTEKEDYKEPEDKTIDGIKELINLEKYGIKDVKENLKKKRTEFQDWKQKAGKSHISQETFATKIQKWKDIQEDAKKEIDISKKKITELNKKLEAKK